MSAPLSLLLDQSMDGKTPPPAVRLARIAVVRGFPCSSSPMTVAMMTMTSATDAAAAVAAAVILFCSAGVLIAISQACASKDRRGRWEGKTLPPPAAIPPMIGLDKQAGRRRATVFNPRAEEEHDIAVFGNCTGGGVIEKAAFPTPKNSAYVALVHVHSICRSPIAPCGA